MKSFKFALIVIMILLNSCNFEQPTTFSKEALNEVLVTQSGNSITLNKVLDKYQGKQVFIDVWASWCKDCLEGLPKLKSIQDENPETIFLFLSVDKTENAWRNGIKKYKISGEHYFIKTGWDGALSDFLNLNWIPRYMLIDKKGEIKLFKATNLQDKAIVEAFK